ncbi:unnamed protein product [Clavelina lepadiformis]|uniref:Glypican-5 n=1 Tax=Clavelina lepadiformis TaxID=159417 RepID=A0ABP0G6C8_CLALP
MKSEFEWILVFSTILIPTLSFTYGGESCAEVRRTFVVKKIGPLKIVPHNPIQSDLQVCSSEHATCCTRKMERHYREAAEREFFQIVNERMTPLKRLVTVFTRDFEADVRNVVFESRNNTIFLLSSALAKADENILNAIADTLYGNVIIAKDAVALDDVIREVPDAIRRFFDEIFLLKFEQHTSQPLNIEQRQCVRRFSFDHYQYLSSVMKKSLLDSLRKASLFVRALESANNALSISEDALVSEECKRALVKMEYCSHCYGLTLLKPCQGLCTNIVRGCLVGLTEMDVFWKHFVFGLSMLGRSIEEGRNDLQSILLRDVSMIIDEGTRTKLPNNLVAEINYSCQLNSHRSKRTTRKGKSRRRKRGRRGRRNRNVDSFDPRREFLPPHKILKADVLPMDDTSRKRRKNKRRKKGREGRVLIEEVEVDERMRPDLKSSMIRFVSAMNLSLDFFAQFPDGICNTREDISLSVAHEREACWDGEVMNTSYDKPISELGLEGQLGNSEVSVSGVGIEVQNVIEDLRMTSKLLIEETNYHDVPVVLYESPYFIDQSDDRGVTSVIDFDKEQPCGDDEDSCGDVGSGERSGDGKEENAMPDAHKTDAADDRNKDRSRMKEKSEEIIKPNILDATLFLDDKLTSSTTTSEPADSNPNRSGSSIQGAGSGSRSAGQKDNGGNSAQGFTAKGLSAWTLLFHLSFVFIIRQLAL